MQELMKVGKVSRRYPPPMFSPVLYYPGYPPMSNTVYDRSGNGLDGTLTAGTWVRNGYGLWQWQADGDDLITCPTSATLDIANNLSVFAVINSAAQDDKCIVGKFENVLGAYRGWLLSAEQSSVTGGTTKFKGRVYADGAGAAQKFYTSSTIAMNSLPHLIGFTFTSAGVLTLYQDGIADPSPTKTFDDAMTTIFTRNDVPVRIGAVNATPGGFFTGKILPVIIYGTVVTASQAAIMWSVWRRFLGR